MSIHLLSDETINKIAAGEVIENPASVVKELVENAVDAKGDMITIEIERGGFSLIRVSDNGLGMGQEDLLLCLKRHATSKIKTADDLFNVFTMGFRGEALASIGSVSKMKIYAAQPDKEHGHEISCIGGKSGFPLPAARSQGTTVEVRSLFYNVPARLNFQKSSVANQNAITRLLTKLCLAHPEKTFRYFADGKELLNLLPGSLEQRCLAVIGESFIEGASKVDFSDDQVAIKGLIGSPMGAKSNRMGQHLFVNGRGVFSPQISRPIYEGYGTRLKTTLHPCYVLEITLPAKWVDVNVHPQKKEVRFRGEKMIQERVRRAVLGGFKKEKKEIEIKAAKVDWDFEPSFTAQETVDRQVNTVSFEPQFESKEEELPVIGLFDSYLMLRRTPLIDLSNEDGIYLVDLEGAVARILYERFLRGEPLPLQTLLFPITLEFTPNEKEQLVLHLDAIKKMGIEIRQFGETTFMVDALTPDIEEGKLQGFLEELAQIFDQNLLEKEREKKLAFSAVYSAKSQKKGWALVEAKQIVKALFKTSSPYHCPRGMKTITVLNYDGIKRLFQKKSS